MSKGVPLVVAGLVFSLVALGHLLRLVYHWQVTFAGYVLPMSFSVFSLIVIAILAIWMFVSAYKK